LQEEYGKETAMKASREHQADSLALAAVGVLGLNLLGIDLLLSEPFGSLMVFSRAVLSVGLLAAVYYALRLRANLHRQPVRVRA
jgi:hypothetical protein